MNAGVGRNIPWSNAERSGEMTKFMARTHWLGGGSFFYTVSPDPVHDVATIQWSAPFTGSHPRDATRRISATEPETRRAALLRRSGGVSLVIRTRQEDDGVDARGRCVGERVA